MTSAQHPRDEHDPSDSPSQDAPSRGGARSPVPAPRERPTYGIRTTGPGDAQGPGGPQGSADRDTQSASGGTTAPGSAASYILARQMGGDAPLIAGVIALTTVGSAVVIPILLALFHFT